MGEGDDDARHDGDDAQDGHGLGAVRARVPVHPVDAADDQHDAGDHVQDAVKAAGVPEDPDAEDEQRDAAAQAEQVVRAHLVLLPPAYHAGDARQHQADGEDGVDDALGRLPEE